MTPTEMAVDLFSNGRACSQAVLGAFASRYGLDDAICNMRVIDAMYASGRTGQWQPV